MNIMNMPGFDAELSLGGTRGAYRGKAVFDRSITGEVLPMQQFLRRTIKCCLAGRHPPCITYQVPFGQNCKCRFGGPVCTPPILQQF